MRDEAIGGVLGDLAEALRASKDLWDVTPQEEQAINALVGCALLAGEPVPVRRDALSLTLTDLSGLCIVGGAAHALIDLFPDWPSWPNRTVADQLKVANADTMRRVQSLLANIDGRI